MKKLRLLIISLGCLLVACDDGTTVSENSDQTKSNAERKAVGRSHNRGSNSVKSTLESIASMRRGADARRERNPQFSLSHVEYFTKEEVELLKDILLECSSAKEMASIINEIDNPMALSQLSSDKFDFIEDSVVRVDFVLEVMDHEDSTGHMFIRDAIKDSDDHELSQIWDNLDSIPSEPRKYLVERYSHRAAFTAKTMDELKSKTAKVPARFPDSSGTPSDEMEHGVIGLLQARSEGAALLENVPDYDILLLAGYSETWADGYILRNEVEIKRPGKDVNK